MRTPLEESPSTSAATCHQAPLPPRCFIGFTVGPPDTPFPAHRSLRTIPSCHPRGFPPTMSPYHSTRCASVNWPILPGLLSPSRSFLAGFWPTHDRTPGRPESSVPQRSSRGPAAPSATLSRAAAPRSVPYRRQQPRNQSPGQPSEAPPRRTRPITEVTSRCALRIRHQPELTSDATAR